MATLYLHIGTHKTGSTSIQHFCEENRAALAQRGYCYPLSPCKYKNVALNINGYFLMEQNTAPDGSFENPRAERLWRRRVARVARKFRRYPNVVLSCEMIWNETSFTCPGLWRNLKREADALGFDVRIIVYFRRQDQFITSLWAQRVKAFSTEHGKMPWAEALDRAQSWIELDYYRHLEEIAQVFGRDAIDARVYDRERFPGGNILPDFLDALGLPPGGEFAMPEGEWNLSIGGNSLEIKRIANATPGLRYRELQRVRQAVEGAYLLERRRVQYSLFSEEERRALLDRYAESNRLLARDYLGLGEESPFPEPEPLPPKWEPQNPDVYQTYSDFLRIYWGQRPRGRLHWLRRFARRNLHRLREARKLLSGAHRRA